MTCHSDKPRMMRETAVECTGEDMPSGRSFANLVFVGSAAFVPALRDYRLLRGLCSAHCEMGRDDRMQVWYCHSSKKQPDGPPSLQV